jgi:mannose-6-phosphate isomerase-like protein (cupin superfamily)
MQIDRADPQALDGAPGVRMAEVLDTAAPGRLRMHLAELDAGALLPRHPAGLDQTFLVLSGTGRVAGADDVAVPVGPGDAVRWTVGEQHTSWAGTAMRVLIVQHG